MGNGIDTVKKHGLNFTAVLAVITIIVIVASQLKGLSVLGVAYDTEVEKVVIDQKQVDVVQNIQIEAVQEDLQVHIVQPGHGVGLERSINMKHRVEVLETKVEQTDRAVHELSIVTTRLAEQTRILNEQLRNR